MRKGYIVIIIIIVMEPLLQSINHSINQCVEKLKMAFLFWFGAVRGGRSAIWLFFSGAAI